MDINNIISQINEIYEIMSINKALFIIKHEYYDELYNKLIKLNYPICKLENNNSFISHDSRIILIRDQELITCIQKSRGFKKSLKDITLILYIAMPYILNDNNDFYNKLMIKKDTYILQI